MLARPKSAGKRDSRDDRISRCTGSARSPLAVTADAAGDRVRDPIEQERIAQAALAARVRQVVDLGVTLHGWASYENGRWRATEISTDGPQPSQYYS
jgi:hypothetical protein